MKVKIELPNNTAISREISKALIPEIKAFMKSASSKVKTGIPLILEEYIRSSPEYTSILSGRLRYHFGIPNAAQKLTGLLDLWMQNVDFQFTEPTINGRGQIKTSFSVSMMKIDFSDVLYSEYASVYDRERGYVLPWLEWLVLEGDRTIVKNNQIVFGPSRYSRTGNAIMKSKDGASWKVPSQYSGTIRNNWITRAIDAASTDIEALLDGVFK